MAMHTTSSAMFREEHGASDGADELRALLAGYVRVLDRVDGAQAVMWARAERPRVLRWIRIPAPRVLVRALLVRHVSRQAEALRRRCCARTALATGGSASQEDVAMLEYFERSLPAALRLRIFAPLALLGTLLAAYILANFVVQASSAKLLGDLTTAALDLDRTAAIEAFDRSDLEAGYFFGAAVLIAWSVVLIVLPVLPAFAVRRRLLAEQTDLVPLERGVFASLGTRRVHDLELDLAAQLLLVAAMGVLAVGAPVGELGEPPGERDITGASILGGVLLAISVVAGAGLMRRHGLRRERRTASGRGRARRAGARVTGAALVLVWALTVLILAISALR
jgi:hypothetical protein